MCKEEMKLPPRFFKIIFIFFITIAVSQFLCSCSEQHSSEKSSEEHSHISPSASDNDNVELTITEQQNIGLKVVKADIRTIEKVIKINGIVKPEPNMVANVSTRVEGRVEKIYVNLGDQVEKGRKLAKILPRQIGNPTPQVIVIAPLSGIVVKRDVSLGSSVEPDTTLFRIADLSKVIVVGYVFENDISKIKLGQDARIKLDAYLGKVFTGKVTYISSELDSKTRILPVWISIDNEEGLLKPELFARVALIVKPIMKVLAVPAGAIINNTAEKSVFVKEGNRFIRQDIVTGASDDRYVEIKEGIHQGDRIVTDGIREIYAKWLLGRNNMKMQEEDD